MHLGYRMSDIGPNKSNIVFFLHSLATVVQIFKPISAKKPPSIKRDCEQILTLNFLWFTNLKRKWNCSEIILINSNVW